MTPPGGQVRSLPAGPLVEAGSSGPTQSKFCKGWEDFQSDVTGSDSEQG